MDSIDRMAIVLFETGADLTDDDAIVKALRSAGFDPVDINLYLDDAIDSAANLVLASQEAEAEELGA